MKYITAKIIITAGTILWAASFLVGCAGAGE